MASLLISEYAEGSSNNKYLEIFNAGTATADLDGYGLANTGNAPTTPGEPEYWTSFPAGSTIAPGATFVVCHPSAAEAIQNHCAMHQTYLSNGDDGYCLANGTGINDYALVDCVGDFNGDPGSGWDVCGVARATKDHTLVRKPEVTTGNPDWASSAGTSAEDCEWLVRPKDNWSGLGNRTGGDDEAAPDDGCSGHEVNTNCPGPPEAEECADRRQDKHSLTIATWNAEWLFDGICDPGASPWDGAAKPPRPLFAPAPASRRHAPPLAPPQTFPPPPRPPQAARAAWAMLRGSTRATRTARRPRCSAPSRWSGGWAPTWSTSSRSRAARYVPRHLVVASSREEQVHGAADRPHALAPRPAPGIERHGGARGLACTRLPASHLPPCTGSRDAA